MVKMPRWMASSSPTLEEKWAPGTGQHAVPARQLGTPAPKEPGHYPSILPVTCHVLSPWALQDRPGWPWLPHLSSTMATLPRGHGEAARERPQGRGEQS